MVEYVELVPSILYKAIHNHVVYQRLLVSRFPLHIDWQIFKGNLTTRYFPWNYPKTIYVGRLVMLIVWIRKAHRFNVWNYSKDAIIQIRCGIKTSGDTKIGNFRFTANKIYTLLPTKSLRMMSSS